MVLHVQTGCAIKDFDLTLKKLPVVSGVDTATKNEV